jgi:hypothetical protein
MMPKYFCTLFDKNYLFKGVAMLQSLFQYCPDADVHLLCMDEITEDVIESLGFDKVTCIRLVDFETDALLAAKKTRSIAEYCWTLSPCLPSYVLEQRPDIDFITYLDADLLFYSPLEPLFEEIGHASISIIEHRFTARLQHLEINGRFCVEWVSFRRDETGLECLHRWRDQCIEWCFYRLEPGRMGDQKYLDEWPEKYKDRLHILKHEGAGIAPWNYAQYQFDQNVDGNITVNGALLIFYHFHQFQLLNNGEFERLSAFYTSEKQEPLAIYASYEHALRQVMTRVRGIFPDFTDGLKEPPAQAPRRFLRKLIPASVRTVLRKILLRYR